MFYEALMKKMKDAPIPSSKIIILDYSINGEAKYPLWGL